MSPNETENERIARRVPDEVATQRNVTLLEDLLADDFVEHGALERETRNREEFMEQIRDLHEAFPDFEATVKDAVTEGDTVAMRVTLSGTHEGDFMGVEPTGQPFEVQNMVFTRIEDGKIAERWLQPDMLGMLQQLGVVESPMD
jgi:steroid delta-isomerase-like uncharacterized protein